MLTARKYDELYHIFVSLFIFSITLPALKDQFTVLILILKFDNEDFTDPGLLKRPAGPHWVVAVVLHVTSVIKQQLVFSEKKC